MRRKLTGKSGHSPAKSKRRLRQRQAAAVRMQDSLRNLSLMTANLLENVGPLADMAKEQMNAGSDEQHDVSPEEETRGEDG